MASVLSQLQQPSWRGINFPLIGRDFGFQQDYSRHRFIFVRDELIEALGRQNPTYRYTIPFRENVRSFQNLFIVTYPSFLDACIDDTDGILVDPVHGEQQVKCVALREIMDSQRDDGIDVEVDFVISPDEAEIAQQIQAQTSGIEKAKGVAASLDTDIERINWQQEEPPQAFLSPFDAISSVANQLEVAANKPRALIGDQIARLQKAQESLARLNDVSTAPALLKMRSLEAQLRDLENSVNPATQTGPAIRTFTVTSEIGLAALAGKLGTSLASLLRRNAHIQGQTTVTSGTLVFYQP